MADSETTKLNLYNDVTINGVRYRRGMNVTVPKASADDIARMDYDAQIKRQELVRQPKEYIAPLGQDPRI